MTAPRAPLVDRIERANWVIGAAVTALCGLVWQGRGMAGAAAGAALGAVNFRVLRWLAARAFALLSGARGPAAAARLVALSTVKLLGLLGLVYLALGPLGLPAVPFTLGISGFVLSIAALSLLPRPAAAGSASDALASPPPATLNDPRHGPPR